MFQSAIRCPSTAQLSHGLQLGCVLLLRMVSSGVSAMHLLNALAEHGRCILRMCTARWACHLQVIEDEMPPLEFASDDSHDADPMDDVFCMTCGGGDDEDQMVLCEGKTLAKAQQQQHWSGICIRTFARLKHPPNELRLTILSFMHTGRALACYCRAWVPILFLSRAGPATAGCDQACHTYCMGLEAVPETDWHCSDCSESWQPNVPMPRMAMQMRSGDYLREMVTRIRRRRSERPHSASALYVPGCSHPCCSRTCCFAVCEVAEPTMHVAVVPVLHASCSPARSEQMMQAVLHAKATSWQPFLTGRFSGEDPHRHPCCSAGMLARASV